METIEKIKKLVSEQKNNPQNEQLYYKERIKEALLNNDLICYALNNQTAQDPDELFGENIKPHISIPETISEVNNYILYDVDVDSISETNNVIKIVTIKFMIICDENTNIDRDTGVARHDLIGTILKEEFNWDSVFGTRVKLRSDRATIIDKKFIARSIIFEQQTINGHLPNGGR